MTISISELTHEIAIESLANFSILELVVDGECEWVDEDQSLFLNELGPS